MADLRVRRSESGQTKIRNVPIAVTPEGFWCCPSPAVFQKTPKNQSCNSKHKPPPTSTPTMTSPQIPEKPSAPRKMNHQGKKSPSVPLRSRIASEDQKSAQQDDAPPPVALVANESNLGKPVEENAVRKISVGFGQLETSDFKVVLSGKEGIAVRMSVHRDVLADHSSFFAEKCTRQSPIACIEIGDCDDVEIYVETVGLMYCKEMKLRLIKQTVPRVLRILKVAESLGFQACIQSCLDYLEATPWVGEEEENVVSSVRRLHTNNFGISPILRRVSSDIASPPNDVLAQILELVLKSNDDMGRREMKPLVLKLLKENSLLVSGSADICTETLYCSSRSCLDSLLRLFRQAAEPGFSGNSLENKDSILRQIALESDNLLWLVEIMADRHIADEFVHTWASLKELAMLHGRLHVSSRHLVNCITSRLFIGIGKGEMLPSKDTRLLLLQVWLQPLIEDYRWLQFGCRSFDCKVVEEGIGRTILTLPLEDQQNILLSWLGSFLKVGDNCPNLQQAFEVWWRRTFIRPYVEQHGNTQQGGRLMNVDRTMLT